MTNKILATTGLDSKRVSPVVEALADLLANYQVYYSNLRGFHWNVRGPQFYVLHEQFEKMYNDVAEKVDEIAERLLQWGGKPENRYSEYLKVPEVEEQSELISQNDMLANVMDTTRCLIKKERMVASLASEADDEVTVDLMVGYLAAQEKEVWMLSAYLSE